LPAGQKVAGIVDRTKRSDGSVVNDAAVALDLTGRRLSIPGLDDDPASDDIVAVLVIVVRLDRRKPVVGPPS
jgi:hypothetical protein